jgi:hypothetical protein
VFFVEEFTGSKSFHLVDLAGIEPAGRLCNTVHTGVKHCVNMKATHLRKEQVRDPRGRPLRLWIVDETC